MINEWYKRKANEATYLDDMLFLQKLYKDIEGDVLAHDSYSCEKYKNSISFPSKRFGFEHSGQVFNIYDIPIQLDMEILKNFTSPQKCRRKRDWIYG
jgi:hypothetical protein